MGLFDLLKRSPPPSLPAPQPSEHTGRHAAAVLDHLTLLHPEEPERIEIRARLRDGQCFIDQMDVPRVGPHDPPSVLVDDHLLRTAFLGRAAHSLWVSLGLPGDARTSFSFFATPSSVVISGLSLDVSPQERLHGPEFMRWLRQASARIAEKQARLPELMASLGQFKWRRDTAQFEGPPNASRAVRAQVLGSYAPAEQTWCWAWANRGLAEVNQDALLRVRDQAALPVLSSPGFPCTEPFAFAVAHVACAHIDSGLAVFRWPQKSGVHLFFAVAPD